MIQQEYDGLTIRTKSFCKKSLTVEPQKLLKKHTSVEIGERERGGGDRLKTFNTQIFLQRIETHYGPNVFQNKLSLNDYSIYHGFA